MREWEGRRARTVRRWEEETGKERESDRKKGSSKGGGGVGAGAEADRCELQAQGQPTGKGTGVKRPTGPQELRPRPPCGQRADRLQ